jgi:hypothetical protein
MKIEHDKLSLLVIILFVLFATSSFILSFFKYIYIKDYSIEVKTECDPLINSCFAQTCSDGDPRCVQNDELYYYKITVKKGSDSSPVEKCEQSNGCIEIYCSEKNVSIYSTEPSCF